MKEKGRQETLENLPARASMSDVTNCALVTCHMAKVYAAQPVVAWMNASIPQCESGSRSSPHSHSSSRLTRLTDEHSTAWSLRACKRLLALLLFLSCMETGYVLQRIRAR